MRLGCDQPLDAVVAAPGSDSLVVLAGGGDGTFALDSAVGAGVAPQNLASGDLNNDGNPDIVVANGDSSFSVLLNECEGGFEDLATYPVIPGGGVESPGMPIAVGNMCPGQPNSLSVAVAVFDRVFLTCGDGSGQFDDIVEPHGDTRLPSPMDYEWDASPGN